MVAVVAAARDGRRRSLWGPGLHQLCGPCTGWVRGNGGGINGVKPTVSLGVTCAGVCTYGCGDGRIVLTRCAIIDAGLDGRCRPRRTCRTPPAAARSARNALAAGLRPVSTADPGAFPRSRTTLPAGIRPCGDASPPRYVPGIRPCLPH